MRGILFCWMSQADQLERFKNDQIPAFALHSRFNVLHGDPIPQTADPYPHLQIDVIALYLLYLAQMIESGKSLERHYTFSVMEHENVSAILLEFVPGCIWLIAWCIVGLKIIFTMEEVHMVQNLVFYLERAYRTPVRGTRFPFVDWNWPVLFQKQDFGMWERGDKYNTGSPELHARYWMGCNECLSLWSTCSMAIPLLWFNLFEKVVSFLLFVTSVVQLGWPKLPWKVLTGLICSANMEVSVCNELYRQLR